MRNCPHCQFLLTTDSDTCAVCNLPVEQPPPVPAGLVAAMAPTEAAGGGSTPGAGGAPPAWSVPGGTAPPTAPPAPGFSTPGSSLPGPAAPGSPSPGFSAPDATPPWAPPPTGPASGPTDPAGFQVAPVATKGKKRVIAVVLGLVGLVLVALVGLTFVGTTTESADVVPDRWGVYTDPDGRYSVELPGSPVTTSESEEVPGVGTVSTDVAEVTRPGWSSAVVMVSPPADFEQAGNFPLQPMVEAMFDGLEAGEVFDDVALSEIHDMGAPPDPAIEGNLTATQEGKQMVGRFRAQQIGSNFCLIITMGSSDRQVDVDSAYARTASSFIAPAGP